MAVSPALNGLVAALQELKDLQHANPKALAVSHVRRAVTRVIGRASVVLLSSHFERYLYALNEELVTYVNQHVVDSSVLPMDLKLVHSKRPVDDLFQAQWTNRGQQLANFVAADAWLWQPGVAGSLHAGRLLAWMKSPKPSEVRRYFRYWGIPDIFAAVTRNPRRRQALELKLAGLVDKRNNIAHGDLNEQATWQDLQSYAATVLRFCGRVDRYSARHVARLVGGPAPW